MSNRIYEPMPISVHPKTRKAIVAVAKHFGWSISQTMIKAFMLAFGEILINKMGINPATLEGQKDE